MNKLIKASGQLITDKKLSFCRKLILLSLPLAGIGCIENYYYDDPYNYKPPVQKTAVTKNYYRSTTVVPIPAPAPAPISSSIDNDDFFIRVREERRREEQARNEQRQREERERNERRQREARAWEERNQQRRKEQEEHDLAEAKRRSLITYQEEKNRRVQQQRAREAQEQRDIEEATRRSLETYAAENARRNAAPVAANWQPNEGQIVRAGELIMELQRQLGRQPSTAECKNYISAQLHLNHSQATKIMQAMYMD